LGTGHLLVAAFAQCATSPRLPRLLNRPFLHLRALRVFVLNPQGRRGHRDRAPCSAGVRRDRAPCSRRERLMCYVPATSMVLATQRLSDFATQRLCDSATQRLSDSATQRLCDFATLRLCDFARNPRARQAYNTIPGMSPYVINIHHPQIHHHTRSLIFVPFESSC
jgi:hypothetical protein